MTRTAMINRLNQMLQEERSFAEHCEEFRRKTGEPDDIVAYHRDGVKALEMALALACRMEKALRDIEAWARAYPVKVFPEPTNPEWDRITLVLRKEGITLDAVCASIYRHVLDRVINIAKDGLSDADP